MVLNRHSVESHRRTLIKTISWKILATIVAWVVIFITTGDRTQSTELSLTLGITGAVVFYLHERLWNRIHWEKIFNHHKNAKNK